MISIVVLSTTPMVIAQDSQPRIVFCQEEIKPNIIGMETEISVELAINEIIGNTVTAFATLTDDEGTPIIAAPIKFYVASENEPSLLVGHAITDCYGVAILRFNRDQTGPLEITAKFDGANGIQSNEITATMELMRLAEDEVSVINLNFIWVTLILILVVSAAVIVGILVIREDKIEAKL